MSTRPRWTEADIPGLHGKTAVVSGANSGIGLATAQLLAAQGAAVVLACRNAAKADTAADRIRSQAPGSPVSTLPLDLASLASIQEAASRLRNEHQHLDLLINNAGRINPTLTRTADGFEATFGINHLGTFAFTGQVLDLLLATPGSRIVTVSSVGHRRGRINFDDLQFDRGYRFQHAYFQSKLANLMFTYELDRRLVAAGAATIALAAHPGNARTEFGSEMPALVRVMMNPRLRLLTSWLMQSAEVSALSVVRAATDPNARGGEYYGPGGWNEFTGYPERADSTPSSHDPGGQHRLWEESERLTGITYHITAARRDDEEARSSRRI
jgi:NAD(P)-dependent dehydrogenase (short-subunit alcohol dehydrogenase family)